jgi:aryl carrier-like protein
VLVRLIRDEVARMVGSSTTLDERKGFIELGLDSLSAINLKNRLASGLGASLPSTTVFDHPNIEALAAFLAGLLGELFPRAAAPSDEPGLDDLPEAELQALLAEELGGGDASSRRPTL